MRKRQVFMQEKDYKADCRKWFCKEIDVVFMEKRQKYDIMVEF